MKRRGALSARNDFGSSWSGAIKRAEAVDPTMVRKALLARVICELPRPTTPKDQPRLPVQKIHLGVLVECREPAGRFMLVAGRLRVGLTDAEWNAMDEHCQDEIGEARNPARMAMRWFVADDAVLDGRPDQFSLLRTAMAEPSFALRVDAPEPLPAIVRQKLAAAHSVSNFVALAEEAAFAAFVARCSDRSVGFITVFPDLSQEG